MSPIDATVFVVDDDPAVRRGVSRRARSAGFSVKTFASPVEFLQHQLPQAPACVLLDMCMDELNGLEVQDVLRQDDRQVPFVFLSGHGASQSAPTSIRQGAADFR